MDNKKTISFNPQKILQTPLVSRLEKGPGYQPFNLNMQTYYETNQKFNNKLRRVSAIRRGNDLNLAELEKMAASGNLNATLKIANMYLSQQNQKKQQKAYTFLENTTDRFIMLHDKKWAIEKYGNIIANIHHSDMYKVLQKKSNGIACYILGCIAHLQYLFAPTKKDIAAHAITYYESALLKNISKENRKKITASCDQLYNTLIYQPGRPFEQLNKCLPKIVSNGVINHIKKIAQSGNITEILKVIPSFLKGNKTKQKQAYQFLNTVVNQLFLSHVKKEIATKYYDVIRNFDNSDVYKILQKKTNGEAFCILGHLSYLQNHLFPDKKEKILQAVNYYETALLQKISEEDRKKITTLCGQLYTILVDESDGSFEQLSTYLHKAVKYGARSKRELAMLYMNKKDPTKKDFNRAYCILQELFNKKDKSLTITDLFRLGFWYREHNNEFKAFPVLKRLADIDVNNTQSDEEKRMIRVAALFAGHRSLCGFKKGKNWTMKPNQKQAEKYLNKALQLGVKQAHFYLGNIAMIQKKYAVAQQEYEALIKDIDVDECKQKNQLDLLTAYSLSWWHLLELHFNDLDLKKIKFDDSHNKKITNHINEIIYANKHYHGFNFLYETTDPAFFQKLIQYTNLIKKKKIITPGALNLCYIFGRICVELNKNKPHGLHILQYAANEGNHPYAQAMLGLSQKANQQNTDKIIFQEGYLAHALHNKLDEPKIKNSVEKTINVYTKAGSLIGILIQASLNKSDKELEDYLKSYKIKGNHISYVFDYKLFKVNLPKPVKEVIEKIKKIALKKDCTNIGALVLAGRILAAEGGPDDEKTEKYNIDILKKGIQLLEKARQKLSNNKLIPLYLGRALNKAGNYYYSVKQDFIPAAQFFARDSDRYVA